MTRQSGITIKKLPDLKGSRLKKDFIRLPYGIYRNDPNWIPPLEIERSMHLSPSNPYFRHAKCAFWVAYLDGKPAGRISAQIDRLYLERYREKTGFFGMLEAEKQPGITKKLLETAEKWLASQGMEKIMGPFNLSINQECGLLIKGFDTPPSMMMGHAQRWYSSAIEAEGYQKAKDLLAYTIDTTEQERPEISRILEKTATGMRTRGIDKSRLQDEMDRIFAIFNDAWSENWGFVPFTREEYMEIGSTMKYIADSRLIRIAEIDGEPAAFIVVLPNINEAIQDLDGRLFPFGWAKLLWRLKVRGIGSGRVLLMGVIRKYRDSLAGAALAYSLFSDVSYAVKALGMKQLELSWILEDNMIMRRIIESIGGKVYKTYRIYSKELVSCPSQQGHQLK